MSQHVDPPLTAVRDAVLRALAEDLEPLGDITTDLLPLPVSTSARLVSRAEGVLAGTRCAAETFEVVDPTLEVHWNALDGSEVAPGEVIATLNGPLASMLTAERTALNFLGHLSGIATMTRRWVRATHGNAQIWDTRKTTPGLRALEKAAVRAGGGVNHRGNLSDWVMFKDNHLTVLAIDDAVARARRRWPGKRIHVECDRVEQALAAAAAGADLVLLDNMTPDEVAACVEQLRASGGPVPLVEVSGGVTMETVGAYGRAGADLISAGSLTNSAPVLDIGLDVERGA
jgi:nicotinate-nucleotide pyrophosphorylase (carboxylating)